ncbi:sensor histidine kinase [Brachybacterium paraconglomeratum]|uniref:sensor histidine kinase n=1 Tax=Brachybacterium paraconglomeratum TaxID=173362 RepID=UPI003FD5C3CB
MFGYDLLFLLSRFTWNEISPGAFLGAVLLSLVICVLYVVRKSAPAPILAGVLAAAAVQTVLGAGLAPAPVLVLGLMLYTLGSWSSWKLAIPALLLSGMWTAIAAVPVIRAERARIGEIGMLILAYLVAVLVGRLSRSRRDRMEALQERADRLARERDAQAMIAAAEERARIAREIHDVVSHSLGTMVVMADGAAQTAVVDPVRAGDAMARVRDTGREAMVEMRSMLGVLRDDDPTSRAPQPGLAQLDRLVAETRATGIRVDVTVQGAPEPLPPGVDLTAYRIVQESLTNARRHGGALLSLVTVTVAYGAESLDLSIVDDGRALTESPVDHEGHGLVGMRERVSAYGGFLSTGPRADGGFIVRATLPVGGAG